MTFLTEWTHDSWFSCLFPWCTSSARCCWTTAGQDHTKWRGLTTELRKQGEEPRGGIMSCSRNSILLSLHSRCFPWHLSSCKSDLPDAFLSAEFPQLPQKGEVIWGVCCLFVTRKVTWNPWLLPSQLFIYRSIYINRSWNQDLLLSRDPKTQKAESNPQSTLFGPYLLLFILLLVIFLKQRIFFSPLS